MGAPIYKQFTRLIRTSKSKIKDQKLAVRCVVMRYSANGSFSFCETNLDGTAWKL